MLDVQAGSIPPMGWHNYSACRICKKKRTRYRPISVRGLCEKCAIARMRRQHRAARSATSVGSWADVMATPVEEPIQRRTG